MIATTADGGLHWTNVTPPGVTDFMKVFIIDPGRFDPLTAYAAVNTLRLDDMNPHIYRTHDGGKTWKEIVDGIPGGAPVSVVREDPKRKGLLFAGSETQVYVSFDDGDHWQSLRLNMAASSVRDLVIKDDDLVVGTHGRGIWILDDITPLRQIDATTAQQEVVLFKPQTAWRVRWNMNTDTPLPPDEPTAPNPPEGAIVDYYLKSAASGPVTLEILSGDGKVVRRYSSDDEVFRPDPATITIPLYWFRPPMTLATTPGMHRFTWDVHYQPIDGVNRVGGPTLPIAAIGHDTVPAPTTPWANPGSYTVRLTVNGKAYSQSIVVKQDPRVKTSALAMQQVYSLSKATYDGAVAAQQAVNQAGEIRDRIAKMQSQASGGAADGAGRVRQADRGAGRRSVRRRPGERSGTRRRWTRRCAGSGRARVASERSSSARGSHDLSAGCGRPADDDATERDCERAGDCCARHDAMDTTPNDGASGVECDAEVGGDDGDRCARFFEPAEVGLPDRRSWRGRRQRRSHKRRNGANEGQTEKRPASTDARTNAGLGCRSAGRHSVAASGRQTRTPERSWCLASVVLTHPRAAALDASSLFAFSRCLSVRSVVLRL